LIQSAKSENLPDIEKKFSQFFSTINAAEVYESLTHATETQQSLSSDIAKGLGMALCLINKKRCQKNTLEEKLSTNKEKQVNDKVLIVLPDLQFQIEQQYLNLINSAFCANETSVSVDILIIKCIASRSKCLSQTQLLMNQLSDLTSGVLHICEEIAQLYHILNLCLMMDHSDKSKILNSSNQTKVDYRTATFDTKKLVSSGFVCSICLAVYEKFYSICPTCDSIVKVDFQKVSDP